jgi:hypothetical protein
LQLFVLDEIGVQRVGAHKEQHQVALVQFCLDAFFPGFPGLDVPVVPHRDQAAIGQWAQVQEQLIFVRLVGAGINDKRFERQKHDLSGDLSKKFGLRKCTCFSCFFLSNQIRHRDVETDSMDSPMEKQLFEIPFTIDTFAVSKTFLRAVGV